MEQGFFLAKELNIPWSDIEEMKSRDRMWLVERLDQWFKDKKAAQDREDTKSGGGLNVGNIT